MEPKTIKQELDIVILDDDINGGGASYGTANANDYNGGGRGKRVVPGAVKLEVDINGGIGSSGFGAGNDSGSTQAWSLLPAFLRKTFDLVENPETDSVISWSGDRRSFIVWDAIKFASEVIPRHFRHNNFHSFIVSLNAYGFRKIHPDRWEFANEGFQGGKRHLLNTIKRRKKPPPRSSCADMTAYKLEMQLDKLRADQNRMKIELLKVKRQQEDMQNELADVEKRLQSTKCTKQILTMFVAKVFNPTFLQQFIHQVRQKREVAGDEISKKRKLIAPSSIESSEEAADTVNQNGNCNNQNEEKLATLHSDIQSAVSPLIENDESGCFDHDRKAIEFYGTSNLEFDPEDFITWEKLLEDDLVFENEGEEELAQHHSKIVIELEDLIDQQTELGSYVNELVEKSGREV